MQEVQQKVFDLTGGLATNLFGSRASLQALPSGPVDIWRSMPVIAAFAMVFFLTNWGLRLLVLEPFYRSSFKMKKARAAKCAQSVMEALSYGTFSFLGLCVVLAQPFVWPSNQWFDGYREGKHASMRLDLQCYYLMYTARYVQMFVSVLLEPRRKDFVEMLLHHAITCVAALLSLQAEWNRIGSVTMLLLDPADVPLHVAKVCRYMAQSTRGSTWQWMADRFFEAFAATFFTTRILVFSYVVYESTTFLIKNLPYVDLNSRADTSEMWGMNSCIAGISCVGLLYLLLFLQLYWFYLILKVVQKVLSGQGAEDVRSDDDSPPDDSVKQPVRTKGWNVCGLVMAVLATCEAWFVLSNPEVRLDLPKLLHSLMVTVTGSSSAIAALPARAPNIKRDTDNFRALALAFFIFNWGLRLTAVEPFVSSVLQLKGARAAKFAQSVMEVVFYGGFTLLGLLVVPCQEFAWPSSKWWEGWEKGHEVMRLDLQCYYIMYMARYSQAFISVLLEFKRKDFMEMVVHHLVTVALIYVSYVYGYNRIGAAVMVLLDPGDVPLHCAKLCKYVSEVSTQRFWQVMADRFFEIFGVVFFVTRIVFFGYVCWSAHIESARYFSLGIPEYTCILLLYVLFILQVYWFHLIVKVAIKLLAGKGVEDIRSDDEEEKKEEEGKRLNGKKKQ